MVIYKIGSDRCPICTYMSSFDSSVAKSLGYDLVTIDVDLIKDHQTVYQFAKQVIGDELALPTYLSLDSRQFFEGGANESDFRRNLETKLLPRITLNGQEIILTKMRVLIELSHHLVENQGCSVGFNPDEIIINRDCQFGLVTIEETQGTKITTITSKQSFDEWMQKHFP
jgi:hypothetical protein